MTIATLSDHVVVERLKKLAKAERTCLARFLAYLGEAAERRLYASEGYANLFSLCREGLGLTEAEASNRCAVAGHARRFPRILTLIEEGKISLTVARRLGPVMTDELLEWAIGKTVEEVDQKVAGLKYVTPAKAAPTRPKPLMLVETPDESAPPPVQMPKVRPDKTRFVTEEVLEYRFAASADFNKALKRAREIARTKGVKGSLEDFMRHVIEFYLDKKDPERQLSRTSREKKPAAKPARPHMPVAVKREVTKRLGYQCSHIHKDGRRCSARAGLHLDHIIPIAKGGAYTDPSNLRWLCPAHNRLAAEIEFGRSFIQQKITAPRPRARPVPRLQRAGELEGAAPQG
jgi:hypothetical protein